MTSHIKEAVLAWVSGSERRLTPIELEKRISQNLGMERGKIRRILRELVEENELTYTAHFGSAFLERSFHRPVPIGENLVLVPAGSAHDPEPGRIAVRLAPGAAFGAGDHPTTRLALLGLQRAMAGPRLRGRALDIGTGSGVLAIAAVLLGASEALGIDIDPCARFEARENVRINGLGDRITIDDRDVRSLRGPFPLVLANLRAPTLHRLGEAMAGLLPAGGAAVVSGIRPEEIPDLQAAYSASGLETAWERAEKGWSGMVLRRR